MLDEERERREGPRWCGGPPPPGADRLAPGPSKAIEEMERISDGDENEKATKAPHQGGLRQDPRSQAERARSYG